METLNADLLEYLLQYLDECDTVSIGSVNHQLRAIVKAAPVAVLMLGNISFQTDMFRAAAACWPAARTLCLKGIAERHESASTVIPHGYLANVRHLVVDSVHDSVIASVFRVITAVPNPALKHLYVRYCPPFGNRYLSQCAKFTNLTSLMLIACPVNDGGISYICDGCKRLIVLELTSCDALTPNCLGILRRMPQLHELSLASLFSGGPDIGAEIGLFDRLYVFCGVLLRLGGGFLPGHLCHMRSLQILKLYQCELCPPGRIGFSSTWRQLSRSNEPLSLRFVKLYHADQEFQINAHHLFTLQSMQKLTLSYPSTFHDVVYVRMPGQGVLIRGADWPRWVCSPKIPTA